MKAKQDGTCYMCEAAATSDEHVPPKGIFPKGGDFRKNLISVRSCPAHNMTKCKEDEYLRSILLCQPDINELAIDVADRALIPSFERRPHIMGTFLKNLRPVKFGETETGAFTVDVPRFEAAISTIVRGLVYFETKMKLLCAIDVLCSALQPPDLSTAPYRALIQRFEAKNNVPYKGANPRVFQYSLDLFEDGAKGICRLRFYEASPIYAVWDKS